MFSLTSAPGRATRRGNRAVCCELCSQGFGRVSGRASFHWLLGLFTYGFEGLKRDSGEARARDAAVPGNFDSSSGLTVVEVQSGLGASDNLTEGSHSNLGGGDDDEVRGLLIFKKALFL